MNTADRTKKTRSAFLKVPLSTKNEIKRPVIGTVMYREIPKSCPAAATPANSAVMVPRFANINAIALKLPALAPYF